MAHDDDEPEPRSTAELLEEALRGGEKLIDLYQAGQLVLRRDGEHAKTDLVEWMNYSEELLKALIVQQGKILMVVGALAQQDGY